MSKFNKETLIYTFSQLGIQLLHPTEEFRSIIKQEHFHNAWFTSENILKALTALGNALNKNNLAKWLDAYQINEDVDPKKVGLILAGNIPLVGFHDVLCVLITGNIALIKASTQDARLIKHVLEMLTTIEPAFKHRYEFVERLTGFDAVIATGSNNTSRYFEYYFGKVPHIIRKNRSSVAVLTGEETADQLFQLGHDIFDYFGLGCRNVSKLYVPKEYSFNFFFESIEVYQPIIHHNKYNNNYGYNRSIFLINSDNHLDNNFLLVKEYERLASPLAVLYFEYYEDLESVQTKLNMDAEHIQCVATAARLNIKSQLVDFGQTQQPALWDYADGLDTMAFLSGLN